MKNSVFLMISLMCLCGCSTIKMENTVWYNECIAERGGDTAAVYTALYFGENNVMTINTSVKKDTVMIVEPCVTEYGKYSYSGNLKKGVKIDINTIDVDNRQNRYKGVIYTDGMILVSQDSIAKGYKMAGNLRLK